MKYIYLSLAAAAILLLGIYAATVKSEPQKTKIAVLTPVTHPSLAQIEKGVLDEMQKGNPDAYQIDIYNANGSQTLMRAEMEEIANGNYALLFSLGSQATQMAREVVVKKDLMLPIVFTAVANPQDLNLTTEKGLITGIRELTPFKEVLLPLQHLKSNIKTLLLVYDPRGMGMEKDRLEIEKLLALQGITVLPVAIFKTNELLQKVPPLVSQADAVMVLKDNTVVPGLDALVKIAEKAHIPLIASDLDSVDKGAALSYGVREYLYGIHAAKIALKILQEGVSPSNIPVAPLPLESFNYQINKEAIIKQGGNVEAINAFLNEGEK